MSFFIKAKFSHILGIFIYFFLLALSANDQKNIDPLELVEQDQSHEALSSADIFNRNLLMGSLLEYTHSSSYKPGAFAWYAHDGNEKTGWLLDHQNNTGYLEVSWGLASVVDEIYLLEKSNKIISYKVNLYDGEKWFEVAVGKKLGRKKISFAPVKASALRIEITTSAKNGGIAEIEVYNSKVKTLAK